MVKLAQFKLKGSVLEPMIALIIVVFAVTAAFTVVLQARQQRNLPQHIRAQQLAGYVMHETIINKKFVTEFWEADGLHVEKNIESLNDNKQLIQLQIIIKDINDKQLTQRTRIIMHNE